MILARNMVTVLAFVLFPWAGTAADQTGSCNVAREIASKGISLFDHQPEKGLVALQRARSLCDSDLDVNYNLGLAYYLSGDLKAAKSSWEALHNKFPEHVKTQTNLAWLLFEMGDDEKAYGLAFTGLNKNPGNVALAHTKFVSLLRMARYLEAYDWLAQDKNLPGHSPVEWKRQAAECYVETLWRSFRRGEHLKAMRETVNSLVKDYPGEAVFVRAKDQLVLAEVDSDAEIPYPVDLPHMVWPKSGNIMDRSAVLDELIGALPPLESWQKREDAYALLVGITNYKRLTARHFGDRDAQNMQRLLTRRGVFLDDADHVRLRLNGAATEAAIRQDVEWLMSRGRLNPNAMLLVYFSGLGAPWSGGRDGLFVPVDGHLLAVNPQTAISLKWLQSQLNQLSNPDVAVIVDACFHGRGFCGLNPKEEKLTLSKAIFASKKAWGVAAVNGPATLEGPGRQGAFTYYLMKGMLEADGYGGGQKDGWVDLPEAFRYAQQHLGQMDKTMDPFLSNPVKIRLTKSEGER